jgi:hypothetical protein
VSINEITFIECLAYAGDFPESFACFNYFIFKATHRAGTWIAICILHKETKPN